MNENLFFTQRDPVEQEEILAALKSTVRWWTNQEIEAGRTPTFEGFIIKFDDWAYETFYETIGEVMHRVKHSSSR